MPGDSFDTIVVGARCAGAPLAVHLARAGQRSRYWRQRDVDSIDLFNFAHDM
jgi:glycine/D-amino acid oxidase-like deaminating enzyme